jgi:TetR/AcrR family transcriptional repressor of nem operon
MPRVSRAQTEKNRETIELVAARLFREQGINGISVVDLMAAAGLTHGGFYGHFDSKDTLAAIACGKAFEQSATRIAQKIAGAADPQTALSAITDAYLLGAHRDNPGHGCPAVALAADIAREAPDKPVRAVYLAGVRQLLASLAGLSPALPAPAGGCTAKRGAGASAAAAEQEAMMQLTALVGAVTLARATAGDPLSESFLEAGRALIGRIGRHTD